MNHKEFNKALKEDMRIFRKHIEMGAKKLAGEKTKERVRNCFHCKVWNKVERFIKEFEDDLVQDKGEQNGA